MSLGLYKTVGGKGEQKAKSMSVQGRRFTSGSRPEEQLLQPLETCLHSHTLVCMHALSLTHTATNSTGRLLPEASPASHWSLLMTNICEVAGVERQLGPGEPFR